MQLEEEIIGCMMNDHEPFECMHLSDISIIKEGLLT